MAKIKFLEYAPAYRKQVKELPKTVLKSNTKTKRLNQIDHFADYCEKNDVTIETEDYHDSLDTLKKYFKEIDQKVYSSRIATVRYFLEYIANQEDSKTEEELEKIAEQIVPKNIMEKKRRAQNKTKEEKIREKQLSEDEIESAKEYLSKKHALLLDFMYYTAVRPGEAIALTPEKLDENNHVFVVDSTWSEGEKRLEGEEIKKGAKHGSDRVVKVASNIFQRLLDWIEQNEIEDDERVWGHYKTDVYRPIKKAFTKAKVRMVYRCSNNKCNMKYDEYQEFCSECGEKVNENPVTDVSPHWFRHIACTRLINEVGDNSKKDVQKHMGHSSVKMTEHYENIDRKEVADVEVE